MASGPLGRLSTASSRLRPGTWSPTAQRFAAGAGTALFGVLTVLAIRAADIGLTTLRPFPLIVLLLTGPTPLILSALEYRTMALSVGRRVPFQEAIGVALSGQAANYLPIPGGAIVRIAALRRESSVGRASSLTLGVGLVWLGTSLGAATIGAAVLQHGGLALLLLGLAVTTTAAGTALVHRAARTAGATRSVAMVELGFVIVSVIRTLLSLWALGFSASVAHAAVLGASSSLSNAIGLVPGGLGVRELLAGGLGTLVDLDVSVGVLTAVLLRVVGAIGAVFVALATAITPRRR